MNGNKKIRENNDKHRPNRNPPASRFASYLTSRITTTTDATTAAPFGPRSGTPSVSLGVGAKVLYSQSAGEEEVQDPEYQHTKYDAYVVERVDAERTLGPVAHGFTAARLLRRLYPNTNRASTGAATLMDDAFALLPASVADTREKRYIPTAPPHACCLQCLAAALHEHFCFFFFQKKKQRLQE